MTSNSRECEKKKKYQKPNLRIYGDVQALTKTVHMGMMNDGLAMKTH